MKKLKISATDIKSTFNILLDKLLIYSSELNKLVRVDLRDLPINAIESMVYINDSDKTGFVIDTGGVYGSIDRAYFEVSINTSSSNPPISIAIQYFSSTTLSNCSAKASGNTVPITIKLFKMANNNIGIYIPAGLFSIAYVRKYKNSTQMVTPFTLVQAKEPATNSETVSLTLT